MIKLIATLSLLSLIGSSFAINSDAPALKTPKMQSPIDKLEGLDSLIYRALETFQIPGAAVGIIIDGNVVLAKGYGFRDQAKRLPVTEKTLFGIGSCTKSFTTNVLAQLVDEGKINWDDPVIKHIPEFRLKDEYATYHVTIRDLLTHQSGLPRHDLLWYNSSLSRNDLLNRLQYLDLSTDLRGKFQYNNLMYVMTGVLIERVTGQSWEEAIKSRVFNPLGMNSSNLSVLESQKSDDFSLPYQKKFGSLQAIPFKDVSVLGPAGSINSNIVDMMKWIGFQMSEGTIEEKPLLKKETLQEMHTPQVTFRKFPEETSEMFGYGLGWMVGIHEGSYFVGHPGGVDGFISSTGFLPKEKIGVVVLTNSDSSMVFADNLADAIFDRILGIENDDDWLAPKEQRNNKVRIVSQENQEKNEQLSLSTARPFSDYIGIFEHPGYGTVRVHTEDDALFASYDTLSIPFFHKCYDHFIGAVHCFLDMDYNCFFVRDQFGDVTELHIPMEPAVEPIVFKRRTAP